MRLAYEPAFLGGFHNWRDTGGGDRICMEGGLEELSRGRSAVMERFEESSPLVPVVIPTHNRPDMLAEALASVRAQTFTDYEIIVVSNGESDEARRAGREAVAALHPLRARPQGSTIWIAATLPVRQR